MAAQSSAEFDSLWEDLEAAGEVPVTWQAMSAAKVKWFLALPLAGQKAAAAEGGFSVEAGPPEDWGEAEG
jgi:hypothetical protein